MAKAHPASNTLHMRNAAISGSLCCHRSTYIVFNTNVFVGVHGVLYLGFIVSLPVYQRRTEITFAIPGLWGEVGIISQFPNNCCPGNRFTLCHFQALLNLCHDHTNISCHACFTSEGRVVVGFLITTIYLVTIYQRKTLFTTPPCLILMAEARE